MTPTIIQVKIDELKPSKYNPRQWPKDAIEDLTKSIKEFGMVDPIIANSAPKRKNIIIGGHFRHKSPKNQLKQAVDNFLVQKLVKNDKIEVI